MNPDELKAQLETIEKKKKRNAILVALGFAVLAILVIFGVYSAFMKNLNKERTDTTQYSLFERIFGGRGNTEVVDDGSTSQIDGTTEQIERKDKGSFGVTFTSLSEKWFSKYNPNAQVGARNIVRPLDVSTSIFDDPEYIKKYGKVNKDEATFEDLAQALEFTGQKESVIRDQIESLENQFTSFGVEFAEEKAELQALKNQLANLEALEAAAEQNGAPLDIKRLQRQVQIEELKKQIADLQNKIADHEQIGGILVKQIDGLNSQYTNIQSQITQYGTTIGTLEDQLGVYYTEYSKLSPAVKSYLNNLDTYNLEALKQDPKLVGISDDLLKFFIQIRLLNTGQTGITFERQIKDLYAQIKFLGLQSTSIIDQKVVPLVSSLDVPIFETRYRLGATANGIPALEAFVVTAVSQVKGVWDGIGVLEPQLTGIVFQLDADKDGLLSSQDFVGLGLTEAQILALKDQLIFSETTGNFAENYAEAYDLNGDGVIEQSEVKKALGTNYGNVLQKLNLTQQLDINQDGVVSPTELDNQIVYIDNQGISWEKFMDAYDVNGDGFVTINEMKQVLATNQDNVLEKLGLSLQLDSNKDGRVTAGDLEKQIIVRKNSGISWQDFLSAYDVNHDRQVDWDEIRYVLDTNYGNALGKLGLTNQLDLDGDGVVTQGEFFAQLDGNEDGYVTQDDFEGLNIWLLMSEFDGSITGVRDGVATFDEVRYALATNKNNVFYRYGLKNQLDLDGDNIVSRPYLDIFGNYVVASRELINVTDINGDGVFERCALKDMYGNCIPEGFMQFDTDGNLIPELYLQMDTDGDGVVNPCYYINTTRTCLAEGYSQNGYGYTGSPDFFLQLDGNGDGVYDERDAFDPYTFIYRKTASLPVSINTGDSWRDPETGEAQVALSVDFTPSRTIVKQMNLSIVAYKIDKKTGQVYSVRQFGGASCSVQRTYPQVQQGEDDYKYCYFKGSNIAPDDYFDIQANVYGPTSIKNPGIVQGALGSIFGGQLKPIITYGYSTVTISTGNSFKNIDQPRSAWYYLKSTNPRVQSSYYEQRQVCLNEAKAFSTVSGKTTQPPCYRALLSRTKYYFLTEIDPQVKKSDTYNDLQTCTSAAQQAKTAAQEELAKQIKAEEDKLRAEGKLPLVGTKYDPRTFTCVSTDSETQFATNAPSFVNQVSGTVDQNQTFDGLTFLVKANPKRTNKDATVEYALTNYLPTSLSGKDANTSTTKNVTFYYWKEGSTSKFSTPLTVSIKNVPQGATFNGPYESTKITGAAGETFKYEFTEKVPDESTSDPNDTKEVTMSGVRSATLLTDDEFEATEDPAKSPVNQSMYQEVSAASPTFSGFDILKQGIVFCGYDGYWPTYDPAKKRFNYTLPAAFLANPDKYGIDTSKLTHLIQGTGQDAKALTFLDNKGTMNTVFNGQLDENELCSWPHAVASFNRIVNIILKVFMPIAIGVIIMIIGVKYLVAAYKGSPAEIVKNKKALKRLVFGILVVLSAFVIVRFIVTKLNQQQWFGQFIDVT